MTPLEQPPNDLADVGGTTITPGHSTGKLLHHSGGKQESRENDYGHYDVG
jgi:hypothetical protein